MKRMIKRKAFLMGMVVAASVTTGARAQEGGQAERDGYARSMDRHGAANSNPVDVIQEAPEMRVDGKGGGRVATMLDELKGMAQSLSSRTEVVTAGDLGTTWNLEMLQADPARLGFSDNPKVTAAKPVGVSLRLKF